MVAVGVSIVVGADLSVLQLITQGENTPILKYCLLISPAVTLRY